MLTMKHAPGSLNLYTRELRSACRFLKRRSATKLDKHPVGQVANFKQPRVHWPILALTRGAALVTAGVVQT